MSDTNLTGVTKNGKKLEISFGRFYFFIFLKKGQNTKKNHPWPWR
jgi:hypothetical protein